MEETELEEGEALSYHGEVENSTIDPEITLSYIGKKLQNVLGHFQKDFEGGVSAENLGAKFGGYGSFLPTYQRSPSWSQTKFSAEDHDYDTPRFSKKSQSKDRRQNLLAPSNASPTAKLCDASQGTVPMGNSLKDNARFPSRQVDESSFKCGVTENSVHPSDQRTLKVRIKVGSENFSNQKNAEIYSGLGLVVSPSSSLDDSPAAGERLSSNLLDVGEGSPTSILQIMTSFYAGRLLSPLSEDLIYLGEKQKLRSNSESRLVNMTSTESSGMLGNGSVFSKSDLKMLERKKWKPSEKNSLSEELNDEKNIGDQNDSISVLKKGKKTDIDAIDCDELVSNALKLPLLSNSQYTISDATKDMSKAKIVPLNASKTGEKLETSSGVIEKKHLDSESAQDVGRVEKLGERLGSTGNVSESKKGNLVSSITACAKDDALKVEKSHASDQSVANASKGRKTHRALRTDPSKLFDFQKGASGSDEGLQSGFEKSSSGGQRKPEGAHRVDSQGSYMRKDLLVIDSSLSPKSGKRSNAVAHNLVSKNDSRDPQKESEIPRDSHLKDFFGELGIEDDNDSISTGSGRLTDPQLVGKRSTDEYRNMSKESFNGKSVEKPSPPEKDFRLASHMATPGNGPSSEAPTGVVPIVNEDWVSCDKCKKWRLLPLGMNPKCLPEKWRCRMLTWLHGMNSCSIPEEETTNAVRALNHTSDLVPAPDSVRQHSQLHNSIETFVAGAAVDAHGPGKGQQNIDFLCEITSEKEKHGTALSENSTDIDGSTRSSNSKKNLSTSGKYSKLNRGSHSPLYACGFQNMRQSNNEVEKQNNNSNNKESLVHCSDTGTNLNVRRKLNCDVEGSRESKRIKEKAHSEDEKWSPGNYGASLKAGSISTNDLSNNTSGSDRHMDTKNMDSKGDTKKEKTCCLNPKIHVSGTSDNDSIHSRKFDDKGSVKKRKGKEHHDSEIQTMSLSSLGQNHENSCYFVDEKWEIDQRKKKKSRVSKSEGKDACGSKSREGIDGKDRSTNNQHNGQYLSNGQAEDCLKGDRGSVRPTVAANSSSSKVSSSRKNKTDAREVKGSPVESVSSSPLRLHNTDKVTSVRENLAGRDDLHGSYSLIAVSPRRFSGGENRGSERTRMCKKDATLGINDHGPDIYHDPFCQGNQLEFEKYPSEQCQTEEKTISDHTQSIASHLKKSGNGLSSYSKDRTYTSRSELDKDDMKAFGSSHDYLDHVHLHKENTKSRRDKFNERSGTPSMTEKLNGKKDTSGGTSSESSKGQNKIKYRGRDGQDVIKSQDKGHNFLQECVDEKLPMHSCLAEANGNGTVHSLPPLSRVQAETVANLKHVSGSEKENDVKDLLVDAFQNGDTSKAQSKRAQNQNGQPTSLRHSTPNAHKVRDVDAPSPVRRDSFSHAANSALKEAKDLKHLADRLKNSGSTDSNGFYFQAALKFLHGASLLEIGSSESSKNNDLMHSMHIYSSTAKLCEFCAHEFEKSKDMAAAALAYKCVEVAYMRVVYSSHSSANKDRNELQTALKIVPSGESPFSSASDVDNLNQATADKATTLTKVVGSPQVSGSHIISSQNRSGFIRLLNFAQDVNLAMEASRKSRNAFTASIPKLGETEICSLKKALDFNFQDVESLLRIVRVSMEAINR